MFIFLSSTNKQKDKPLFNESHDKTNVEKRYLGKADSLQILM